MLQMTAIARSLAALAICIADWAGIRSAYTSRRFRMP